MGTTGENIIYTRPEALTEERTIFCPGCGHGIITRLVAEVIDELGVREMSIGVAPVGCSVLVYDYFNLDGCEAAHGRAPAVATGLKRVHPDRLVFAYQGDGDLAAIGTAEVVHAATRGELISIVFVNNAIYGMTGGQMAPTTLPGQVTTSTPRGRDVRIAGYPVRVAELLSTLDGVAYIVRRAVYTPALISRTKKAIKKAFQVQLAGLGFSLVEVLSTCPTNWGLAPAEAMEWGKEHLMPYYPLGDYKVIETVKELG